MEPLFGADESQSGNQVDDLDTMISVPEPDAEPPVPATFQRSPGETFTATARAKPPKKKVAPGERVPLFRRDLRFQRTAGKDIEVVDPVSRRRFAFNEYEISLARMFNGERKMSEVISATERLGIPVNLESLHTFIAQLEECGLLADEPAAEKPAPGAITGGGGTTPSAVNAAAAATAGSPNWSPRGQWHSSVRALFQSGIRLMRNKKPTEAAAYFEALLAEDPENEEAKELLAMCHQQLAEGTASAVQPANRAAQTEIGMPAYPVSRRTPADASPVVPPAPPTRPSNAPRATPQRLTHQGERAQLESTTVLPQEMPVIPTPAPMVRPTPVRTTYTPLPEMPPSEPIFVTPPRKRAQRRRNIVIGVLALAVLANAAYFAWTLLANREPAQAAAPMPEPPKQIAPVPAVPADAAAAATAPADAAPVAVAPADAAAAEPEPEPETPEPPTPTQKKHPAPVATAKVTAPGAGSVTSFLRAARRVKKGDKLFEIVVVTGDPDKIKAAQAKVAEMERLAKQDPSVYEPFLADARTELGKVRTTSSTEVRAPRGGLAAPRVKQGANVKSGQLLAEIE